MNSDKKILTRFAPSPSGDLHLGNARSAILNWIYAKKNNGNLILRIDDTDSERSKEIYIDSIKDDLEWLNLDWSLTFKQSERLKNYSAKILELKNSGRLYACFETTEELSLKKKSLLSSGKPPIYDRSSLKLTEKQKNDFIANGKKPHWRFLIKNQNIHWNDLIRGEVSFESKNLSDPILIREDGTLLYHLPSVIDDISENITDIIRGEDHVNNTAFHIQLFEALNAKPPNFGHHPLLVDDSGKSFAKRLKSYPIKDLRKEGFDPISVLNYLSTIGTSKNITNYVKIQSIVESHDIRSLARSSPKFSKQDLKRVNADILKNLSFDLANEKLSKLGIKKINADFWDLIKNNIEFINEANEWLDIIYSNKIFLKVNNAFINECADVLPEAPFTINTWDHWLERISKISNKKGKELYTPLRLALTGKESGPKLKFLLPLLSRKIVLNRLGKS